MTENNELLLHLYQNSKMGVDTTTKLLDILKKKDNKIKCELEDELKIYEKLLKKSKSLMKKYKVKEEEKSIINNIIVDMTMQMEINKDNSDSKVANILIRGFNMGVVDIKKRIKDFGEQTEHDIIKLANESLKFHEKSIIILEKYI